MLTSSRVVLSAAALSALLGLACGDDSAGPEAGACPLAVPTRLWAPPASERPQLNGHLQDLFLAGDRAVFRWGRDIPVWRMYVADLCGDDVVALDADDTPVDRYLISVTDAAGQLAYGYREADRAVVLLDRLDVEGIDAPKEVGRFAGEELRWFAGGVDATYFMTMREIDYKYYPPAAGVGSKPFGIWRHGEGDSFERLPGEFVQIVFVGGEAPSSAGPVLTLTDAGELAVHDLQGEQVAALEQVRYAQRAPGGSRIVWQQFGDGAHEPVFVRDLAAGVDLELTANEHTAVSWGRLDSAQRFVGTWLWVDDDYLGLVGPDDALVAVHNAATGDTLAIPEHARVLAASSEGFWLTLPSGPDEVVGALWSPRDGEVFTWYRQPAAYPFIRSPLVRDGEWHYLLLDQTGYNRGSYWRIDRTTGAWTKLLPTLGVPFVELDDGRIVTSLENDDGAFGRLSVVDLATGVFTEIAEDVNSSFALSPGRGVYYLDSEGADMGLWFSPIPGDDAAPRAHTPRLRGDRRGFSLRDPAHLDVDAFDRDGR